MAEGTRRHRKTGMPKRLPPERSVVWKAILVSWAIALIEYCLAVPANRLGYGEFSGFQLKIIQEVVTIIVFIGFAIAFLKEKLAWNYLVAFAFLGVAAFFAFAFKAPGPAA